MPLAYRGPFEKARAAWAAVAGTWLQDPAKSQFLTLNQDGVMVVLVNKEAAVALAGQESKLRNALYEVAADMAVKSVVLVEGDRAAAQLAAAFNELADATPRTDEQ